MTADVPEVLEAKKKSPPLPPENLNFEDYRSVRHCAVIPRGTDPSLLIEPGYWVNVTHRLQSLDKIFCIWDDRSAMCDLMVLEASPIYVTLVLLDYKKLPGILGDGSEQLVNYEVFFSQLDGYCVRRLSDSVFIVKNASSREKAIEELKACPAFKGAD